MDFPHPEDCGCGREHGEALDRGLSRGWRGRRLRGLLTLAVAGALLALAITLL